MPITTAVALAVAGTALALPTAGAAASAGTADPQVTHEHGRVIECTGTIRHRSVYASLYENNTVGNTLQIVIGASSDHPVGGSKDATATFVHAKVVHAALRLGGHRAVIDGYASTLRHRTHVHEEHDDAGFHIVADGYHRRIAKDLALTWRHRTVRLDCANAFLYDLTVTRTPITN